MMTILNLRPYLLRSTPAQLTYYKPKPLGVGSMCCHCDSHDGLVEAALPLKNQTILPMGQDAFEATECSYPKMKKLDCTA